MAETAMGSGSQLAWIKETVWGTTPGTPQLRRIPLVSETLQAQINKLQSAEIRPDRQFAHPAQGNVHPQGDVNVEWNAEALGFFFYYLLGATPTITGTTPGPYTHVILQTPNVTLPSVTLEKGFKDINQYYRYTGSRVGRVGFEIRPDAFVTGPIGFQMKDESNAGTALDATLTDIDHIPFTSFEALLTENAVTLATATMFNLTIDNQLIGINVIGNRFLGALLAQRLMITGQLEAFFANNTMYAKFRNFTASAITMFLEDADSNSILLDIPQIHFEGTTPQIAGEGPVFLPMPFSASHDAVSGQQITVTVVNTQATLIT